MMKLVLVVLLATLPRYYCSKECTLESSVNISDGFQNLDGTILHRGVVYKTSSIIRDGDVVRGCPCLNKPCVRKCCPEGQAHTNKSCYQSSDEMVTFFSPQAYSKTDLLDVNFQEHFYLVYGEPVCEERFVVNPFLEHNVYFDQYFLQKDGSIYMPNAMDLTYMQYCIDAWPELDGYPNWTTQYLVLGCFHEPEGSDILYGIFPIGMTISIPFLIATFLVYAVLPELRNLHGSCLMCYVFGLLVGYICLSFVQISNHVQTNFIEDYICYPIAFVIYFSFMVSFFWLNIMCFDMWWTFSGFRVPRGERRRRERRRFLLYCLYGFGMPAALTSIVALMQFHPNIPNHHIKPNIAEIKCWFSGFDQELLYFYSPIIVLVVLNICFFVATACKIVSIKRQTSVLRTADSSRHDQYENDKQRFNLYLKLFLVMGVNWTAEWVSFLIGGNKYWWVVTDITNTLQGVFVFFIFVWKKKIKSLLLKRYHLLRYGSTTSRGLSTQQRTHNISSTMETEKSFISTDENCIKMQEFH